MKALACLICGVLLCQCTSNNAPEKKPCIAGGDWVKVSSRPPTYYPRGVPADCATDFRSGEWFDTGDGLGTRCFIPFRVPGKIPRQELVNQAYAMRSEDKIHQIAEEDQEIREKFVAYSVVLLPLNFLAALGRSPPVAGVADLENFKEHVKERFKEP